MSDTRRETVIEACESGGAAAVTPVAVISELEAVRLDEFEELLIYWQVTAGMVGSSPQLRLTLQRALVRDADPAVDAHWDAILKFAGITTTPSEQVAVLPRVPTQPVVLGSSTWTRTDVGLYSLHLTGALALAMSGY